MPQPTDLFTAPVTPLTPDEAARLALEHFGVAGQAKLLSGERDQNFHLRAAAGPGWVLKLHPPVEDPAVVDMQVGALLHLEATEPALAAPRVIRARDGQPTATVDLGQGPQILRLLSYVPGVLMLDLRPLNRKQLRSLGAGLARLDRALQGYDHPAGDYVLLWDLQRAPLLRPLLPHIADPEVRAAAAAGLDRFDARVAPSLSALPRQILHNDCNPGNVIFDEEDRDRLGGVLDFGDMVKAPRVCELAVAASYHVHDDADPFGPTAELVAAYHADLPLSDVELRLLPDLVVARVVQSVTMGCWQAAQDPAVAAQIQASMPLAIARLRRALAVPYAAAVAQLQAACGA